MNPDKCTTMWLGKSNDTNIPCFSIGSQEISFVGGAKLLGVTIDHDLKFNEHIGNIARKVSKQIQVLQRHKKLINIHAKVKLYNAYLLPHLNH